ncbi:MAG: hypothetical protein PHN57_00350 [Candidatus Omnitrophica bacterium]|nr:hypothetical protein [Candidatus Omnitrophota bacterium]
MTDKKFLALIVVTVGVFFIGSLYLKPAKKTAVAVVPLAPQDKTFSKIESEMRQLKDVVNNYGSLNKAFDEEKQKALEAKEKAIDLQQQLKDVSVQKDALLKELAETKGKLEFTQPLRQKLSLLENALSSMELSPERQNQVIAQLDALVKDLDAIDRRMPDLFNENNSSKKQAQELTELLNKKENELSALRQQVDDAQAKSMSLSKNLDAVLEQLMSASKGKVSLEQKVMELEKSLLGLKKSSFFLQSKLEKSLKELSDSKAEQAGFSQAKEQFLKEKEEYKANIALLNRKNQELVSEIGALKQHLDQLNKDYSDLKDEHEKVQLSAKQNEALVSKGKEEIAYFKEKLAEADTRLMEVQSKYKEIKKDSALLREQFVSVQLEREKIRDELDQAKMRLSELQNKFRKIGNMVEVNPDAVKDIAGTDAQTGPGKKVDVELIPGQQEMQKNGK